MEREDNIQKKKERRKMKKMFEKVKIKEKYSCLYVKIGMSRR